MSGFLVDLADVCRRAGYPVIEVDELAETGPRLRWLQHRETGPCHGPPHCVGAELGRMG